VDDLPALKQTVDAAAWRHAADFEYSAELSSWSGRYAATAGVPARSTPTPDAAAVIPARWFAGPTLTQPEGIKATEDNAVVVALGTADDEELSRLRAGEATSLILLTATALGLATCPITEPLEIPETRDAVRADVFGGDEYPQMLSRIGWAPVNADPLPSTPRRKLSEVATYLDGSVLA
jgi:nitroreductase